MKYLKNKRTIIVLLLVLTLVLPSGIYAKKVKADEVLTGVVQTDLYLRKAAGTDKDHVLLNGEKVVMKAGQEVTILGIVDDWYHINVVLEGTLLEGYASGQYIKLNKTDSKTDEDGYTVTEQSRKVRFLYKGVVTANELNMRKSGKTTAKVITVLKKDTPVDIIGSVITTQKIDGKKVKNRWYQIAVVQDKKTLFGYVMSTYVEINFSGKIKMKTIEDELTIYKTAGSKTVLKSSNGKSILLPLGTKLKIYKEETVDNAKWFKLVVTYQGKKLYGYVPELKLGFRDTAQNYVYKVWTKKQEDAEVTDTPKEDVKYELKGANAVVKDAAALAVKEKADYASATCMTAKGNPILLYSGQEVEVLEVIPVSDIVWCYVRLLFEGTEYMGYINSRYIEGDSSLNLMSNGENATVQELSFNAKLKKEGFPESYKPYLRALHKLYPNWEFKTYKTGLDWNKVIEKESAIGLNLLPNTKAIEWKSLESGAYSWKTDSFIPYDGSTWVTASKEAVAYYMDPRNFLDYNTIFQFEVLAYNPACQTKAGVEAILKNTAMSGASYKYTDDYGKTRKISYADTFIMAAEYSGVSPLSLASRVKQEVTLGASAMSNSVSGTVSGYEGLYNYYNIGANNSTNPGENIANGLRFAKNGSSSTLLNLRYLIPWTSPFRSILGGAFYLGNNYISKGQNTLYLQKFNVTPNSTYIHQYMANIEAPYSEGKRVYGSYEDPASLPLVFSIPVYENMPEEASPAPAKAYNPNNWLKSLKVSDSEGNNLVLTPSFAIDGSEKYSLIVDNAIDNVKVKAVPVSSKATVLSDDKFALEPGNNRITVRIKAENGDIKKYIINIVREEKQ